MNPTKMDVDSETPDAPESPIYVDQQGRWCVGRLSRPQSALIPHRKHLYNVLSKRGPFTDEDWNPGPEPINALESSKIL